jgi:hypothetical protein
MTFLPTNLAKGLSLLRRPDAADIVTWDRVPTTAEAPATRLWNESTAFLLVLKPNRKHNISSFL